jgi:hypothetical protein
MVHSLKNNLIIKNKLLSIIIIIIGLGKTSVTLKSLVNQQQLAKYCCQLPSRLLWAANTMTSSKHRGIKAYSIGLTREY